MLLELALSAHRLVPGASQVQLAMLHLRLAAVESDLGCIEEAMANMHQGLVLYQEECGQEALELAMEEVLHLLDASERPHAH